MYQSIVSRGDWVGKPANIKFENNGAVDKVYVGSSLTEHNPLFFCSQIVTEKNNAMFLLVSKFKTIGMLLNIVYGQVQKS